MRYIIVRLLRISGMSGACWNINGKVRLAQNQTVAECVSICNRTDFSCAQNAAIGACVSHVQPASAVCKIEGNRLK